MASGPEGTVVADRYELGALLGRGGMGEVRKARDRRLSRDVAVKVLDRDERTRPEALSRFEYEARAAAAVAHPNIVAVYDFGDDGERLYLVMELLDGRTLHDDVARGAMEPTLVVAIALDVLAGLGAAHARGIVHRDIKPGNVLFDPRGRAKLGDFGVATSGSLDLTQTGMVLGTPAYLAPERLEGRRATPQSDIFAVGVMCYEALAGEKPFSGDNAFAIARAIERGTPPPLDARRPEVPPALSAAILRAMAHDPDERYETAEAFAAALRGSVGGMGDDETTGRIGPVAAPTQAVPRVDRTSAMPLPVTSGADSALPAGAQPARAPASRRGRTFMTFIAVLLVVAIAIAVVLIARNASNNNTTIPNNPSLPSGPVKDSFDTLQKLLKP